MLWGFLRSSSVPFPSLPRSALTQRLSTEQEVVSFFNTTVNRSSSLPLPQLTKSSVYKTLPTFDWLVAASIVPSSSTTYTLQQLQDVAQQKQGTNAVWNCKGGNLNEVRWGFDTIGNLENGQFVPTDTLGRSTCPRYVPQFDSMNMLMGEKNGNSLVAQELSGAHASGEGIGAGLWREYL